eukprot:7302870-Prymnesium_polylepis.1
MAAASKPVLWTSRSGSGAVCLSDAAMEFTCCSSRGSAQRDVREPPEGSGIDEVRIGWSMVCGMGA